MKRKSNNSLREVLDLSERESVVYMELVRRGWGSALDLSHGTGLARTSIKSILDRLAERGVVLKEQRGNSSIYTPEEPETVLAHERARLTALEAAFHNMQDQFFQVDRNTAVRVYDKPRSIRGLLTRVITDTPKGSTVCAFESPASQNYEHVMSEELLGSFVQERVKKGIHLRILVPHNEAQHIRDSFLRAGVTVHTLTPDVAFTASYWIFGKSLVFFSGEHTLAVEIRHKAMFTSMQSVFDHLWGDGTPYNRL